MMPARRQADRALVRCTEAVMGERLPRTTSLGARRHMWSRGVAQFRCLHYCSDYYRMERTSSRAGLTPAVDHHLSRRTR